MKYTELYARETANLLRYYANKNSPVKRYIGLCEKHISELESDAKNADEYEYIYLFQYVLMNAKETFRPEKFIDEYTGKYRRVLDVDFMIYFLSVKDQLKGLVGWKMLCQMNVNYALWKCDWLISKKNIEYMFDFHRSDKFLEFAISKITLRELYGFAKINENLRIKDCF